MDFMKDQLVRGKNCQTLNVIDGYNHEGLAIDVDRSLSALRVIRALERIMEWRGNIAAIC